MRSTLCILSGAALLATLMTPASAQAPRCAEGRTVSGECVNSTLARVMRKQAIIATQPKFSYTAPLYLPSESRFYTTGRDYHELRVFFGSPPCGGTVVC